MKRLKVNTLPLLQIEVVECGAASLGIICSYYGLHLSLEKLRTDCGVSRDGTNALNIIKAAEGYGLRSKGMRRSKDQLFNLNFPYIVFWNQNHFLVVEGYNEKKFFLNDPALGKWWVTHEEFAKSYSGIVLTFEPGPNFKKGGKPFKILPYIFNLLRSSKSIIFLLFTTTILGLLPAIILPAITRIFVDFILIHKHYNWYIALLVTLLLSILSTSLLLRIQQKILQILSMKLSVILSYRLITRLFSLPLAFYLQRSKPEVASRIEFTSRVSEIITGPLLNTLLGLTSSIFFFIIMISYSVKLSLIGFFLSIVSLLVMHQISRRSTVIFNRFVKDSSSLSALYYNVFNSIESIKSSSAENTIFEKWAGTHARYLHSSHHTQVKLSSSKAIPVLLSSFNIAFLLLIGGSEVMNGNISVGMLLTFTIFYQFFTTPLQRLSESGNEINILSGYLRSINDVLNFPIKSTQRKTNLNNPASEVSVKIENVSFGYNKLAPPILSEISLSIPRGSTIAFVGLSGSGKSTLAKLISGLYEPWEGAILINGINVQNIESSHRANILGVVDQEIELFSGKIKDVLTFWDDSIPENMVIEACKIAEIHDIIAARPGGYYSILEEGGRNFSGGERQRMEIARALIEKPRILIMDEATSALDPETEFRICNNIKKIGITLIIIAHRLSTIKDADKILVLDKGKILDSGSHEQLKKDSVLYKEFLEKSH